MFPKLNTSDIPSSNLRRPYSARRGNGFQDAQFDRPQPVYDYPDGLLDLSIHHPSTPFGNRFAPLARLEASFQRDRESYASRPHRRSRNSRGTKEAKKRRDSRRNKRKYAVHLLNEQLSRDIGETLLQYNVHSSPLAGLSQPNPDTITTPAPQHLYNNGSKHVAPCAPQLLPITFHGFSLPDFSPLVIPRDSSPHSPIPLLAGVPAWCPPIPSLRSTAAGSSELPKFYDLSCLRDPNSPPGDDGKCQSLQLHRGSPTSIPNKQSRFFPPRATSPKPMVRLPPTGNKCRMSDAASCDPSNEACSSSNDATRPDSITQAVERIIAAAVELKERGSQSPSAANLWNILAHSQHDATDETSEQNASWEDQDLYVDALPQTASNGQDGPYELDATEVPYVHTNSLTGYANETAAHHSGSNVLGDSAIYLADVIASGISATPAYELYGMPLARSFPTPTSEVSGSDTCPAAISAEPFINVVVETKAEITERGLEDSVAHFESEQELFAPPQPTEQLIESSSTSVCDLATFLSMGHVNNCWCATCEEEPELVSDPTIMESEEPFTEEDGWMMWSTECDSESTNIAASDSSALVEEGKSAHRQCTQSETWDYFFPRTPCRTQALGRSETDLRFIGYFDDGAAFANVDEDGWEWGC